MFTFVSIYVYIYAQDHTENSGSHPVFMYMYILHVCMGVNICSIIFFLAKGGEGAPKKKSSSI